MDSLGFIRDFEVIYMNQEGQIETLDLLNFNKCVSDVKFTVKT